MGYSPVPAVLAGDWIDEVFINTYWVDNMAAGVPDIFTAKGQLAVASGANAAGVLGVGADGTVVTADAAELLGVKWEQPTKIVFFSTFQTSSSWDGDSKNLGTYTINISDFYASFPAGVRALVVSLAGKTSVAGGSSVRILTPATGFGIYVDIPTGNKYASNWGLAPVTSGQIKVIVAATTTDVYIEVQGYVL